MIIKKVAKEKLNEKHLVKLNEVKARLQTKISKAQNEHKRIIDSMDEWTKVKRNLGQELESKMKEVKFETFTYTAMAPRLHRVT